MGQLIESVLETYLRAYRNLIAVEPVGADSVTISFPFHLAADHRVELTITDLGNERCIISDAARTIGELEDAGYRIKKIRERLEAIAKLNGLTIARDYLLLESSYSDVRTSMQKFLETSKTIGDAYLVHRQRASAETTLVTQVKTVLDARRLLYREREKLHGKIEDHTFDLVITASGHSGAAVNVLGGQNTHPLAQTWYFKCDDIRKKETNANTKLVLIYDDVRSSWSDISKRIILESKADIVLPGDSLESLSPELDKHGIAGVV